MKKIKQIIIEPGCISCGRCQEVAPTIFHVTDHVHLCSGAHDKRVLQENAKAIARAAAECPVQVIRLIDQEERQEAEKEFEKKISREENE